MSESVRDWAQRKFNEVWANDPPDELTLSGIPYRRWPPEGAVEVEVDEWSHVGYVDLTREDGELVPPEGRYLLIRIQEDGE